MNIKLLDSWLKDYLKTAAKAKDIAEKLSLTSASIEHVKPHNNDYVYDIEITTNRIDLVSSLGLAREAAAILPEFGIEATFTPPDIKPPQKIAEKALITIKTDPTLVYRICAVVMQVQIGQSPLWLKERLEEIGIRSLNNLIDITNYLMRDIGHPTHVFDYDRLITKKLIIRQSKKGEKIITLDKKTHTLLGGDIVADNGDGEIVDLIGIMGTANSVVTDNTKRILFFIDNNDPLKIRKTSMNLGIRTEAAQLNEKNIDPDLAFMALLKGISLYKELAQAELLTNIIDIYPKKAEKKTIKVLYEHITRTIGIAISPKKAIAILTRLGFTTKKTGDVIVCVVPSWREKDVIQEEDIIEEIARVYGYHNLPSELPPIYLSGYYHQGQNEFFWENRVKEAFKYWGFTEVYSYSMVSEEMFEGPINDAVTIHNPLHEQLVYMRNSLTPSLLQILKDNKALDSMRIFELASVYKKTVKNLPKERLMLAGIIKNNKANFYEVKGIIQQLMIDCGIKNLVWKKPLRGGLGADIFLGNEYIGDVEILEENIIDFELNFDVIVKHATLKRVFTPLAKYPPVLEDLAFIIDKSIATQDIITEIKKQSTLIREVTLLDIYKNTKTFHVIYQHEEKNLTTEDITPIRERIIKNLKTVFAAEIKEYSQKI